MGINQKTAKSEVLAAEKEAAASIALGTGTGRHFPAISKPFKMKFILLTLSLFIIIATAGIAYFKLFAGNTTESQTLIVVESIRELATLATAEAVITSVIKEEDNKLFNKQINLNFPGTKRTSLLIVPATVLAGVDLSTINEEQIEINEENKEITLTLPHATFIQEPSIQMDKIQTYSEEGLFRSEVKWDEGFDLVAKANTDIKNKAVDMGLLQKAEESAEKVIHHLFSNLGYTTKIKFE
jgi:hypothetical protein